MEILNDTLIIKSRVSISRRDIDDQDRDEAKW